MAYKLEAVNVTYLRNCYIVYMQIIAKDMGIIKQKEIYLPDKESMSGHRCEMRCSVAPFLLL